MTSLDPVARTSEFDAAIFDMDGVVTQTASLHSLAWKRMFDSFLQARAERRGEMFREFTHHHDYRAYVDGRPRYRGVEAFLASRGITLPFGSVADAATEESICGLGNRKNAIFNALLSQEPIAVYPSSIALIEDLLRRGVRVGLATSSRNAAAILSKSGTLGLFSTVVDGLVSERLSLHGKPAPDIFVAAAHDLGAAPQRAIVVEDAVSGVQAGARGCFALVLGVARENNARELAEHGADLVVTDLSETNAEQINQRIRAKRAAP